MINTFGKKCQHSGIWLFGMPCHLGQSFDNLNNIYI